MLYTLEARVASAAAALAAEEAAATVARARLAREEARAGPLPPLVSAADTPYADADFEYGELDPFPGATDAAEENVNVAVIEAPDHYSNGLKMPGRTISAGQETRVGYT